MALTWDDAPPVPEALALRDDERAPLEGGVPLAYVAPTPFGWWIGVTHDLTVGVYESREAAQEDCERLVGGGD